MFVRVHRIIATIDVSRGTDPFVAEIAEMDTSDTTTLNRRFGVGQPRNGQTSRGLNSTLCQVRAQLPSISV